jgi:hypothetical protein
MDPSWQSWRRKKIKSTPRISDRVKSADKFRRAKEVRRKGEGGGERSLGCEVEAKRILLT